MLSLIQVAFFIVLGMSFGSFVTVLISRLYYEKPGVIWGRSQCSTCEKKLPTSQLIPLFSYIAQKGESKCCKKKIAPSYPTIEAAFGALWGILFYTSMKGIISWPEIIITNTLLILFFYDLLYLTVDRRITIPTILFLFVLGYLDGNITYTLYGSLIGGGVFLFQYLITRGRGIGEGDIDLGIILGAIAGFPSVILGIVCTYILGSIILLPLWALGIIKRNTKIPLGAFLLPISLLFLFFSEHLWEFYWNYPLFI